MKIYIPSKARADQKWHTWEALPPAAQKRAFMVIGPDDADAYAERFPMSQLMVVDVHGIGAVRQHIIDISEGPVLMLDDDLSFFVRREDDRTKLAKATPRDVSSMLRKMEQILRSNAHAAIAVREGANRNTDPYLFNTRCLRALGYDASVLKAEGVSFDRLPVMEDFDVALQLLRKGYQSVTLNEWCQDQGTSNAPGGCSTYRTMDVQAQGAEGLAALHPGFVKVVTKTTKTAWGGQTRKDVQVSWKKAYESGKGRVM